MLEQLCGSKEQSCRFLCPECLADIEQIHDTRKEGPALSWTDGGFIEDTGLLDNGGFVVVIGAQAAFVLFLGGKDHGERGHFNAVCVVSTLDSAVSWTWMVYLAAALFAIGFQQVLYTYSL
jgi:hypothetical protein